MNWRNSKTNHLATDERIKLVLETGEKQLKAIDDGQDRIGKTLVMLREVAAKSNDPEKLELKFRVQELAERINLLISRGEIPEALEAYDKLIKLVPDEQDYKDKREKLLAEWTPKDEEHRKARETIKTWATTRTIEEFQDRHPNVFKALNTHIAREDRLGLLKFTQTFEPLSLRLSKIIEESMPARTTDRRR